MVGKMGDNLAEGILNAVLTTQEEITKEGINATAIVKQVIVTGTLEIRATIIIDLMQIVTIQAPDPRNFVPGIGVIK
jgi:hypothetical protein